MEKYIYERFKVIFKVHGVPQSSWREFLSLDAKVASWYKSIKLELQVLQSMPIDFLQQEPDVEVKDLVLADLNKIKEARSLRSTRIKHAAEKCQKDIADAEMEYKSALKNVSNWAIVASLDVTHIPLERKVAILSFGMGTPERHLKVKNVLSEYKKDLYKLLKEGKGQWPDDKNPLK